MTGQAAMRRIALLDTWVNDTNLGNRIIMEAVEREVRRTFRGDFVYHVPAMEHVRAGRPLVVQSDYVLLAGTNMISADMDRTGAWRVSPLDIGWLNRVILMGVGWWQYQARRTNSYTRLLLRGLLSARHDHSVRDAYTERRMRALGFRAVNTGCPSTWELTPELCATVPTDKAGAALLTVTEYHQNPQRDAEMLRILREHYDELFLWPQQFGDLPYVREVLGGGDVNVLEPSLPALDEFLREKEADYVGTRLHAGIRALQHGRRTIIIGVDNRAIEMGRDLDLPVVHEGDMGRLAERIEGGWVTRVQLPGAAIASWRAQFDQDTRDS